MQPPSSSPAGPDPDLAGTRPGRHRRPARRLDPGAPPGPARRGRTAARLERFGLWLRDHQRLVFALQAAMLAAYLPLVFLPAALPAPGPGARPWSDPVLFVQALFWGVWLPLVLVSVLVFGRLWCGVFCPEGALSAAVSRHGRGRAIPGWMKWPHGPLASFAVVTVWGQAAGLYDDPAAAALILGTTLAAAVVVGAVYGREKRVWCRFLCPVNGLFALLAKLAPMRYRVDGAAWDACLPARTRGMRFTCEPMVPVRTMDSASPCHMCGRCAGFRDAVRLAPRAPWEEILAGDGSAAETAMTLAGLIGLGSAAFWWTEAGAGIPGLLAMAAALSAGCAAAVAGAARLAGGGCALFHRLALALVPLGAAGLLTGFGRSAAALFGVEALPLWGAVLAIGAFASLGLARGILGQEGRPRRGALAVLAAAVALPVAGWAMVLWP